jgi:uncharacterized protein YgfB (UPF0149 family)
MMSPGEAHGIIAGLLATSLEGDIRAQLADLFSPYGLDEEEQEDLFTMLAPLYRYTKSSFEQGSFEFALLLPDEEATLEDRIEAIADWCRGFIYGLTEGGVTDVTQLPGDAGEVVRDLMELAEVGLDESADVETQDKALAEIEEYIRVGVQLVFEELGAGTLSTDHPKH